MEVHRSVYKTGRAAARGLSRRQGPAKGLLARWAWRSGSLGPSIPLGVHENVLISFKSRRKNELLGPSMCFNTQY